MYQLIYVLIVLTLALTACNNEVQSDNLASTHDNQIEHKNIQVSHTENNNIEPILENHLLSLPEHKTIIEQVGDQGYTFELTTDNNQKRIMFLVINGNKHYKTIFNKQTNRLRIINIYENGGEIFNGIISRR
ncbi:hypothetical protein [Alkalibacillus aidingensis]|uniref:hypothetical protein n=1 Tax=Alkalibacillus aidingensis TaxID=2747607 RepID=UPI001660CFBE|nr:hypothetical protein [Alkalibacillus aidingensis]